MLQISDNGGIVKTSHPPSPVIHDLDREDMSDIHQVGEKRKLGAFEETFLNYCPFYVPCFHINNVFQFQIWKRMKVFQKHLMRIN